MLTLTIIGSSNTHRRRWLRDRSRSRLIARGSVMAQEAGLIYNIYPNGPAGDWYWDVRCDGSIIARGLASTRAQARADAITSAAGLGDEPREDRTLPLESPSIRASLKITMPPSSTTEMKRPTRLSGSRLRDNSRATAIACHRAASTNSNSSPTSSARVLPLVTSKK